MQLAELLQRLGYSDSPNFLRPASRSSFEGAADFSHIFRRAHEYCNLRGVYSLRHVEHVGRVTIVPVVYVCEAQDDQEAERIHRAVWNQNVVPFLIVAAPRTIRLYFGFRYDRQQPGTDPKLAGVPQAAQDMNAALDLLEAFRAERIDDGTIWDKWGDKVTPETRVDWRLLGSLSDLDVWLRSNGIEDPEVSHALIGKYVYLHYLRERGILSDRWLAEWELEEGQIFGRHAQVAAFWRVVERLDDRLNGSVFPLKQTGPHRPRQEHIRTVAGTFKGDDPASGQLALDFGLYDFSFIPIETLSVVYEQFLHSPKPDGAASRGKTEGAYYTPIPLVNFMLEELHSLRPFQQGMRVLDPACGSGAFLVQSYRRIIEQDEEFEPGTPMRPARLRKLLERHVFGIDRDPDACRVAELSLSLTLLDYVYPPDLRRTPSFRLPDLHGTNIHQGDFFDPDAEWRQRLLGVEFDWIVGNPPWIELKGKDLSEEGQPGGLAKENRHVWTWMQDRNNQECSPVGGNQVAEAFAWKVTEHLADKGCVALLLPAMTLFKDESRRFRQQFFSSVQVHAVANFANLAEVLFPGHGKRQGGGKGKKRPRRPAAAFIYSRGSLRSEQISVFSPLVAEQPSNRPTNARGRKDTWNIVIDASQIRAIETRSIADGSALPWKTAMWGSHLDLRLLCAVASRFDSFDDFRQRYGLTVSQGLELRKREAGESTDPIPQVAGRLALKSSKLRRVGRIFEVPESALESIPDDKCFVRHARGELPLTVCEPPHIILDRVRRFAVFSDEFIVVPPRQIGIAGEASQTDLLKALSLYLVSDFTIYHQFFLSPEWGISTSTSTLDALRALPVPFPEISDAELSQWAELHGRIVQAARNERQAATPLIGEHETETGSLDQLLDELNDRVFRVLRFRGFERALVRDLVHLRMQLIQGKVSREAVGSPSNEELRRYSEVVTDELDAFVDDHPSLTHSTTVFHNGRSAIVAIRVHDSAPPKHRVRVEAASSATAGELASIRSRIREKHSQWIYFERNLRLYEGRNTYVFKPLQRLHWTESQAILDAGTIIAETLG